MTKVTIQRATYSELGIERLLVPLGGMTSFVERGDRTMRFIVTIIQPSRIYLPNFIYVISQCTTHVPKIPCVLVVKGYL